MTIATTREARDLLETLEAHRGFLRQTLRGLTDDQIGLRTTVSELTLGGILKHVTAMEQGWVAFIVGGPGVLPSFDERVAAHQAQFVLGPDDTLAALLDAYEAAAHTTADVVAGLPSLDTDQPLPEAPWFESGASWSARRVLLHVLAETAQHAGHADIIREALDGAKTMG